MPPKLMWPESALCEWPLHRAQRDSLKTSQFKGDVAEYAPCEWLLHHLTHRRHFTTAPACLRLALRQAGLRAVVMGHCLAQRCGLPVVALLWR